MDTLRAQHGHNRRTEISTLNHEVLDNTVKLGALVAKALIKVGTVLLDASRQRTEVLYRLGDGLVDDTSVLCLVLTIQTCLHHRKAP